MTTLGQVPSPADIVKAATYVHRKVEDFRALGPVISTMQRQAAFVLDRAVRSGQEVEAARGVFREVADLHRDYLEQREKLERLIAIVRKVPGLGLPPAVIAAAAAIVTLAIAMGAIFRRKTAAEKALDLVARGVLTPQEADKLRRERGGLFGGLADAAKYIAIGVGLYFGLPLLAKVFR